MIGLTRKTDYALVALARLADPESPPASLRKGLAPPLQCPVSVRKIAKEYDLPLPQMMNVFKALQKAGLVRSVRGPRGGYFLADQPDQIRLISVVEAIEGPIQLTLCCDAETATPNEPCLCTITHRCPITTAIHRVNQRLAAFLSTITIQDLMTREVDMLLPTVGMSALHSND